MVANRFYGNEAPRSTGPDPDPLADASADCCEMCGASFVEANAWRQTAPVERWLCDGCNQREGGAIKRGSEYRSECYPAP
jgi:hypothetical protein